VVEIVLLTSYIFLHNVIVALLPVRYSSKYGPWSFCEIEGRNPC